MNKVIKLVLGFVFSAVIGFSANAQRDSAAAQDEAIVCREVSENVFDCYLKQNKSEQENYTDENRSKKRKDDLYRKEPSENRKNEAPTDWNRTDVIEENRDDYGLDIRKSEPKPDPYKRKNEDNIHMPGDNTQDDNMYERDVDKQERELMNEADDETYYQKRREELGIEA
jgi:hypothetical protein